MFETVLIANRGEIACRIMRTARRLGLRSVAVYSEADGRSPHVIAADETVLIGPPPPLESYLNIDNLLQAARDSGCDAVHPGYGFLSENAEFVRRCHQAGLIFIGPSSDAMEKVGDKLTARAVMAAAGIPMTPGVNIAAADWAAIARDAQKIGYPVMIKATAGGGGKGMRIVHDPTELQSAIEAGRREAMSAFGNDAVYMEKFIEKPRHIEFQVLADTHGNVIHLCERECTIQRRHQKIIEETPAVVMDEKLREEMGEIACRVMKAVNYTNAGTVEFLLDAHRNYYFLEVNARLQVEHPITELVTGVDLVKQQIRIARGEPLSLRQSDISQRGHAIECRIYAEDAENNFFPSIGRLHLVREPAGPGIRCDSGIRSSMEITHHYDPILSKLIVLGEDRRDALQKMDRALADYAILGVKTSIRFLRDVLAHPAFVDGDLDTGFIKTHMDGWQPSANAAQINLALMAASLAGTVRRRPPAGQGGAGEIPSPWTSLGGWELL